MNNTQIILTALALVSSGAFSQTLFLSQLMECKSGDRCVLDQRSTDLGKTYQSVSGGIVIHDNELKAALGTAVDLPRPLHFEVKDDGTINGIATKEAVENAFETQKGNSLLKQAKEREDLIVKLLKSAFGNKVPTNIELNTSLDYAKGTIAQSLHGSREVDNDIAGLHFSMSDSAETLLQKIMDFKKEYDKVHAFKAAMPETLPVRLNILHRALAEQVD